MSKPFETEYGYLVKNMTTGNIDTETHWPKSRIYAENTSLVSGYEWVKVRIDFTEVAEND